MSNENIENKENKELKASTIANREKKKEAREAKAARKAANEEEDKKKRPSNLVLTILIFGVIIFMFVFVKAYGYFSKPADIEAYLSENGGEDTYTNMTIDAFTTADITAEGNSMTIAMKADTMGDDSAYDYLKEYYEGEDGEETLKYLGAYFLTSIKPDVRGFSADVTVNLSIGDEEVKSVKMTYKEAKDFMEEDKEEAEAEAEAEEETEEAEEEASEEVADDAAEAAEDAAEEAAEGE